jgi:hypothetical protein
MKFLGLLALILCAGALVALASIPHPCGPSLRIGGSKIQLAGRPVQNDAK